MAKKTTEMSSELVKRLKALGITAKTEDDARAKILRVLEENGCDGFDDSPLTELCDILESIILADADVAPEQTEEEEVEQMAEEETREAEEETEETSEDETEEEEAEETEEGVNLDNMSRKELIQFIKDNSLPIKVLKSMSDEDIRNAICDFITEEPEEEETEEEAPAPTPKKEEKKSSKKEKKAAEPEKQSTKTAKAKPEKKEEKKFAPAKKSAKLDPKNNDDDRKELLNALTPYFPEDKFEYAWVVSAGVTIKHKGSNGRRGIMLLENCTRQADGAITCNAYLLTFAKKTDLLEQNDVEYSVCWNGNPFFKHITLEDLCGFIDEWKDEMLSFVEKVDKKLGENRKKMEENLEKKSAPAKTAAKKAETKTPAKKVTIPKKTVKK